MDRALKGALLATLLVAAGAHAHAASAAPPSCLGKRATIVGTTRADRLRGTPRADVIAALGGDDVVSGLGGADRICGDGGNDRLDGDGGRDTVDGGLGANWCRAERLRRCDTISPALRSAAVRDAVVELTFSEPLRALDLAPEPFIATLQTAFGPRTDAVVDAEVTGDVVRLTLEDPVAGDEDVGVAYYPGESSFDLTDVAGNAALDFETAVANESPAGCANLPPANGVYGEAAYDRTFAATAVGTLEAIALFVDFPDVPAVVPAQEIFDEVFPPAARYLREASYGRLQLDVVPRTQWIRMQRPSTDYTWGVGPDTVDERLEAFVRDALRLADAETDFSRFEAVYVLAPRQLRLGSSFASSQSRGFGTVLDGNELRHVSTLVWEPQLGRIAAHETSHFFGLPDLYDLRLYGDGDRAKQAVGNWDPMSALEVGADFLAWHKWKLGWVDPPQIRCVRAAASVEETLTPLAVEGGVKAIVVPTGSRSAYVVENRQPTARDAALCDQGALVYSVDATVVTGQRPVLVRSAHLDGDTDVVLRSRCGPLYNAPFDIGPGEVSVFADDPAGVRIEVLSKEGLNLRVRVTRR